MTRIHSAGAFIAATTLAASAAVSAATCPFDNGGSDAVNDGVVLTRYALGITGTPLVASTRYASLDPLQVKNNIECVGCALDMNGDNAIDTVDTTIIARHLAGFSGNALTNGLALGSGTRNTPASVQSFLASGCAVGGAINAFVQGGNAFGVPAILGTNDVQSLTLQSAGAQISLVVTGGDGFRVNRTTGAELNAPNIVGGSSANNVSQFVDGFPTNSTQGGTVSGGGHSAADCFDRPTNTATRNCGNEVRADFATVSGGIANRASGYAGVIGGGDRNTISGAASSTISGGADNWVSANFGTVAGGLDNRAGGDTSVVAGGRNNFAGGFSSIVAGGERGVASGNYSFVAGGLSNNAQGNFSFAAGRDANAFHSGSFVWADNSTGIFASSGTNEFNIRAAGGVRLHNNTSQFFGSLTRQMLNLWGTEYGVGVQSNTLYYRSGAQFSWFIGGEHCDLPNCPYPAGGTVGTENMRLTSTQLLVNGTFVQGSDRAIKENFAKIDTKTILAKVAELPLSLWNYRSDEKKTQHLGPMAQDFKRLFGIGQDDKTIATVDAAGVAFAAIQGLHAKLKEKDAEIAALTKKASRVDQLERRAELADRELRAIKKRLGM